jgi:hypothetical protein
MGSQLMDTHNHPAVLNKTGSPEQFGPDGPHITAQQKREHLFEPVRGDEFEIIV